MKKHKKYIYKWIDCMTEDVWTREIDLMEVVKNKTSQSFENIGYFVQEYKGYYVFSSGINMINDKVLHYFSLTIIPKGQIIKFKELLEK